jgi:hypothetical protein
MATTRHRAIIFHIQNNSLKEPAWDLLSRISLFPEAKTETFKYLNCLLPLSEKMDIQIPYPTPAYAGIQNDNGYPYRNYSCKTPTPPAYEENTLVTYALGTMNTGQLQDASGIDMILSGKKELIRSKIELLLIQIGQRKAIHYGIDSGIDYDSCKVQSLLLQMREDGYLFGKSQGSDRKDEV